MVDRASLASGCLGLALRLAAVPVLGEQVEEDLKSGLYQAFVADAGNEIIGMALIYPIYSTWKGLSYYLEDIIVKESYRRQGIGTQLFEQVLKYAAEKNAGRLGWQVLDWNEPAITFYKKYNASLDPEWLTGKLSKEQIEIFKAE